MHSSLTGALDMSVVWKIVVLEMIGSRMEFGIASDILGHSYRSFNFYALCQQAKNRDGVSEMLGLTPQCLSAFNDSGLLL